jgi:hypothetical protein
VTRSKLDWRTAIIAWVMNGQAGNTRSIGFPFMDKGRVKAFSKDRLLKITQFEQKPA